MSEHRFEFSDGKSNKFWSITLSGNSFTVTFGRIGTSGQVQTKSFGSDIEAKREHDKLINEKLRKGYERVQEPGGAQVSRASQTVAQASQPASQASQPAALASQTVAQASQPAAQASQPAAQASQPAAQASQPASQASQPAAQASQSAARAQPSPAAQPTHHLPPIPPTQHYSNNQATISLAVMEAPPSASNSALPSEGTTKQTAPNQSNQNLIRLEGPFEIRIDLTTEQRLAATGPKPLGLPKPAPRPFNLEQCAATLEKMATDPMGYLEIWSKHVQSWSREEAHLWLIVALEQESVIQTNAYCQRLRTRNFDGNITTADVLELARGAVNSYRQMSATPMAVLLPLDDLMEFMNLTPSGPPKEIARLQLAGKILTSFRQLRLPYLNEQELDKLRTVVRKRLHQELHDTEMTLVILLAIDLGMHDLCEAILEGTEFQKLTSLIGKHFWGLRLQDFIFGVGNKEKVLAYFKRYKIGLDKVEDVYAWLIHTDYSDLDRIAEAICNNTYYKESARDFVKALSLVHAPEAAGPLLRCYLQSEVRAEARKWLDEHAAFTFAAVVDFIVAKPNATADEVTQCKRYMRDLLCKIDHATVPEELKQKLEEAGITFEAEVESSASEPPNWLATDFETMAKSKGRKAKLPAWLQSVAFAPIVIDGWKLTASEKALLLEALQQSELGKVHPLVKEIRTNAKSKALDKFLWDIFDRWQIENAPPKEKWCFISMGFLASDQLLMNILPLMYSWREQGLAARAGYGLECLRASGSDFALMTIHQISDSPKLKSLRMKAVECMMKIAEDKGLTKDQLEDRIVPTCGLDARGKRIFDFGERKFTASINSDLKIIVRDDSGKVKTDLPSPTQKDDAALASSAVEEFKELKKQIKLVAKAQVSRLEQSMVTGRKWATDEFQQLLLHHPLMCNFVRMVVWSGFDAQSKMMGTFRVMEENECADIEDRQLNIELFAQVGIAHPLFLDDATRAKWSEIFGDYEIVSPFPQLARPVYHLTEQELAGKRIERFAKLVMPSITIPSTLERLGWSRGAAGDGGWFSYHYKHFFSANVTAVAEYEGMPMGLMLQGEPQAVDAVYFMHGIRKFTYMHEPTDTEPLSRIDRVVISEVLNDMTILTAKAQEE